MRGAEEEDDRNEEGRRDDGLPEGHHFGRGFDAVEEASPPETVDTIVENRLCNCCTNSNYRKSRCGGAM